MEGSGGGERSKRPSRVLRRYRLCLCTLERQHFPALHSHAASREQTRQVTANRSRPAAQMREERERSDADRARNSSNEGARGGMWRSEGRSGLWYSE